MNFQLHPNETLIDEMANKLCDLEAKGNIGLEHLEEEVLAIEETKEDE